MEQVELAGLEAGVKSNSLSTMNAYYFLEGWHVKT